MRDLILRRWSFPLPPFLIIVVLLSACSPAGLEPTPASPPLSGGILATFDVLGEQFNVWVTNPGTIEQILALQSGQSTANIPNGRIWHGPGQADHNLPYSWHLDPEDITMAEATIELCDGLPSFVEEEVDYFVETVQRYCPWEAMLVAIQDFRE